MRTLPLLLSLPLLSITILAAADDITIADFEGADYGAWTASGKSFGTSPANVVMPGKETCKQSGSILLWY
jgi:hypothetical protein